MEQKSKISWKETLQLHGRAFLIFWKQNPRVFLSRAIYALVTALAPYVGIYLSALLVNELAGGRDIERIFVLAGAAVASELGLTAFSECIKHWDWYENAALHQNQEKIYVQKLMDMDFADMDSQKTHDLYSQIQQNQQWNSWGLILIPSYFETGIRCVMGICGAATLTAGLFLKKVPDGKGMLKLLDSPLCIPAVLALMIAAMLLSSSLGTKAGRYMTEYAGQARFGNRVFGFFSYDLYDNSRALDMRMYNQQDIGSRYFTRYQTFGAGTGFDRLNRGKVGVLRALSVMVSSVFSGAVYLFVCLKAWAGAFGIGSVTQYVGAVTQMSSGIGGLFWLLGNMQNNTKFLRTTFEFLDIPNNMYQGSLTVEKRSDRRYEIEFRNVSFKYPGSEEWALKNVSFIFRVGERLALVGENGSGKTTFIKLLCRLYDPTEGEILLNGIDIRKYDYKEYMSIFSVVFQDFQLLSYGLGENVAVGQQYDEELVKKCLKEANFGQRLEEMPEGLKTKLYKDFDDKGVEISGGEAQKIALARALYKDAPFIILDEPTAALDPLAEQEVYENFNKIVSDRTAVYISHRLSSCRFCDVIAVFDHGQIVQHGSHEELVKRKDGKYHTLWYAQAQYYV